jgi:chromosome segregation ATPase
LTNAKEKLEKTKKAIDTGVDKITSPIEKGKKALDATKEKIVAPFKMLKAKQQQAKNQTEDAEKKVDAAKKILNIKEFAREESKKKMDKAFGSSIDKIKKAKKNIEDSQKGFMDAGDLVKSLLAKIEAKGGTQGGKT